MSIKTFIKKMIYNYYPKFLTKKYIMFESNPDMSDNSYEIYRYMLKKKLNYKYKFIWFVNDPSKFKNINEKNVKFIEIFPKSIYKKILKNYYNYSSKLILDSNNYVHKKHINQYRIHLMHGISYKNSIKYMSRCGEADYFIVPGKYFNNFLSKNYNNSIDKFLDLGFSRNDLLFKNKNIKKKMFISTKSKLILWLPTYRKHKSVKELNISDTLIPIFSSLDDLEELNNYLNANNIYIYLKPHPAQDLSNLINNNFSNFKILLDKDLRKMNLTLYEFLSGTDSLITDYSSVYFDYLLTQKIIGLTLDDYDIQKKHNTLICNNYPKIIKGEHIYNKNDFFEYLNKVKLGKYDKNKYLKELKKYHTYLDGNSTKRLYNFIIEKLK